MSSENEAPHQPGEPPKKPKWTRGGPSPNPGGKRKSPLPSTPAEAAQPTNAGRNKDGTFAKGFAPNPAGKPKGTRHRTTLAMEALLEGEADTITRKAIELAKNGDLIAIRLCMTACCRHAGSAP